MRPWMGDQLRLELLGSSHGPSVGVRLSGLPAGERIDIAELQRFLSRRAPGGALNSQRREPDQPFFPEGLRGDVLTGEPLLSVIENRDARLADYAAIRDIPRPSHADYTARCKGIDPQMLSGRMTAPLCIAGGVCLQLLARKGVSIGAHLLSVGGAMDEPFDPVHETKSRLEALAAQPFPALDDARGQAMIRQIEQARAAGDSVGGSVELIALGVPAGLGEPLFNGLDNRLSQLVFAIPGVKAVSFGEGVASAGAHGSAFNDPFVMRNGRVETSANRAGGILGGISNGMPIVLRAYMKPTPSIALSQDSVDLSAMENTTLRITGRHDPCIAVRAVPAVIAAAAIALFDLMKG